MRISHISVKGEVEDVVVSVSRVRLQLQLVLVGTRSAVNVLRGERTATTQVQLVVAQLLPPGRTLVVLWRT